MRQSLKYTFSFFFFLSLFFAKAQEKAATASPPPEIIVKGANGNTKKEKSPEKKLETVIDTVKPKTDRYGLILGVDVFRIARSFYDSDYKGIAFVGDYRLTKKYYAYGEVGSEEVTVDDPLLNTTTKGAYLKVGFNYNAYTNWLDMENLITIGVRYGFSTFNERLNTYSIYNPHPYYGQTSATESGKSYDGLTASWLEVSPGINVKVFNNIYVGFSLQLKVLVTNTEPNGFESLFIPGFNRTYDGNFGAGFNYTVSYFIPIYKKKVIAAKPTTKK
ncbi:DUF6048 family protein [Flavobacterium aquicola]|uniref:Outer membrane protein with beta-barrel domain n=1 Tax=Flavobacterium aquicola TaxID=1682742 RepID=A0A3E0EUD7_9FLAO|nr:DUF6048 family protein [Flavobacterium aquicola]REH01776.1 hypothetical protein C8P67_101258 [Flavobacterium aquicola]